MGIAGTCCWKDCACWSLAWLCKPCQADWATSDRDRHISVGFIACTSSTEPEAIEFPREYTGTGPQFCSLSKSSMSIFWWSRRFHAGDCAELMNGRDRKLGAVVIPASFERPVTSQGSLPTNHHVSIATARASDCKQATRIPKSIANPNPHRGSALEYLKPACLHRTPASLLLTLHAARTRHVWLRPRFGTGSPERVQPRFRSAVQRRPRVPQL
jgi:hypothetical protein